jgi:hypothetical protein
MIEYRFRVPSAAVFTLYSYSKALEYRFRVPTANSLISFICHKNYNFFPSHHNCKKKAEEMSLRSIPFFALQTKTDITYL